MDESTNDPVLDALWDRVVAAWDDDKPHVALLEHALRSQGLPEIAGRYRSLVDDPQRGPVAKKKLELIVLDGDAVAHGHEDAEAGQDPALDHAERVRGVRPSPGMAGVGALGAAVAMPRNERSTAA